VNPKLLNRRRSFARHPLIFLCAIGAAAFGVLIAPPSWRSAAHARIGRSGSENGNRTLILAVDGLSWEAFEAGRARGLFRRFGNAGRHIAPYPSMSHPAWTEIVGARRVFGGARGNIRTVEARWFDLDAMRIADDPRQVIARQASPYTFQRAFDYYFDPLIEPLMYLRGRTLFDRELEEAERTILSRFTGSQYVAYLGGPDAISHTHFGELPGYMDRLDAMIERVADSLETRGGGKPLDMWMVSDHGNAGGFVEGKNAERYLEPYSLDAAIRRAKLVAIDSGRVERDDQVAVVTIALATMINVYFADLGRRRGLAESALQDPAVDLVTWLEVTPAERHVVILGKQSEARLRWRDDGKSFSYESVRGNPLRIPDSLTSVAGATRWIPDAVMRASTETGPYPDAPFRMMRSAVKEVENAPDLIVNLRDGYCFGGDLGKFVRMVRTHGSLGARASAGILAGTSRRVPASVRGEEVLDVIGLAPESLFIESRNLWSGEREPVLEALRGGNGQLPTGRDDQSVDAAFLRRARPVVLSMDYFGKDAALALLETAWPRNASSATERANRIDATKRILSRTRFADGVTGHLDTLLALADSLDADSLDARIRDAEARIRVIPELAPLAELRSLWAAKDGSSRAGGVAPLRRAVMGLWTVPYFIDAALVAPEHDSIADLRDLDFATRWIGGLRARVAADPARLLEDSTLAPRLFAQVFAERKLWRAVEPATIPLLFQPDLGDITVVYVPGIYGELFDGEIWTRGLRAVHDRLGVRTVTLPTDGRCATSVNAARIVDALRDDTRRRLARGYQRPRYLLLGYSKGGIDATEALLRAPELAREQVAGLVTIATPHAGTPVVERADIPASLVRLGVTSPRPAACDTAGASASLWPSTRMSFWGANAREVASLTRYFSVSFVTDAEHAHPWMKVSKRIAQFGEPNDGMVALSASRFPHDVHAVDLGVVDADHIAGRLGGPFLQDAFLEAVVIAVAELGGVEDPAKRGARWRNVVASLHRHDDRAGTGWFGGGKARTGTKAPAFAVSTRPPSTPAGGGTGWTATRTFRMASLNELSDAAVRELTPARDTAGIVFSCDQRNMLAFRKEYEFYYDAGNGGTEDDPSNGFAIVSAAASRTGRACQLSSRRNAMKMTTIAYHFRPMSFPDLRLRLRVDDVPAGVDPSTARRGRNDAAFKLWLILRDTRPASKGTVVLFGYTWGAPDVDRVVPAAGTLQEAVSSRRNVVLSTLPEAWLVTIGGPTFVGSWQTIDRDIATDIRRAYPGVPLDALQVVGITIQTDSDDTRAASSVLLDMLSFKPRLLRAAPSP
jgi:hypothetical protein